MKNKPMTAIRTVAAVASLAIIALFIYTWHTHTYRNYIEDVGDVPLWLWVTGYLKNILWPWFITVLITISAYVIGYFSLSRIFKLKQNGIGFFFSVGLGFGILSALGWLLGWIHLLYSPVLIIIVLGSIAAGWKIVRDLIMDFRVPWKGWQWWDIALFVGILLFIFRTAFLAANPSIGMDATATHLFQAKSYLADHVLRYSPLFSFIALAHMLTSFQMAMGVADPGSTLQYVAMLLAGGAIYHIGIRYFGRTAALIGVLAFFAQPMVYICSMEWYTAHFVVLYTVLGLYGVLRWHESGRKSEENGEERYDHRWLMLAGLMGGLASASKITGLVPALLLIILSGKHFWRTLIFTIASAFPWYIFNVIHFGNPVFPHFDNLLGFLKFGTMESATETTAETKALPGGFYPWSDPWTQTFQFNAPWAKEGEPSKIGPFMLAFTIPLIFIPIKKWTRTAIYTGVFVLVAYAYWLFIEKTFSPRYLVYVSAVHGLLAAYGLSIAFGKYKKYFVPVLLILLYIFVTDITVKYAQDKVIYDDLGRQIYLKENRDAVELFQEFNENHQDIRLYAVGFKEYRFFADFDMIDDKYVRVEGTRYRHHNESAQDLYSWLKNELGRTHIWVNDTVDEMWFTDDYLLPFDDPDFLYYFTLAFKYGPYEIFMLQPVPGTMATDPEVFEEINGDNGETESPQHDNYDVPETGP